MAVGLGRTVRTPYRATKSETWPLFDQIWPQYCEAVLSSSGYEGYDQETRQAELNAFKARIEGNSRRKVEKLAMLSPLARLASLFKSSATRSLDAAGGGRRWADDRRLTSAGAIHADAATINARAAHFALNTPMGRRIVESLVGNLVGDGIKSRSQHPDKTIAATLNANFALWIDRADAEGRGDFFALQQAAINDLVVFGEAFSIILPALEDGAPQLRRCHPEQLARDVTRLTGDGGAIVQGVEFDRMGRIIAYHVRRHAPGDPLSGMALMPIRLPASDVLHTFRPIYPGQVRGLSWLAPVLLTANDHDRLVDAMLQRAKVAALHAGFVRDAQSTGAYSGEQSGGELTASLEPGALITLPPGKDIEFPDVPNQDGAMELVKDAMRRIAAGVGLTYEMLTGDYSQVNYSSARAGMLEFRRFASGCAVSPAGVSILPTGLAPVRCVASLHRRDRPGCCMRRAPCPLKAPNGFRQHGLASIRKRTRQLMRLPCATNSRAAPK